MFDLYSAPRYYLVSAGAIVIIWGRCTGSVVAGWYVGLVLRLGRRTASLAGQTVSGIVWGPRNVERCWSDAVVRGLGRLTARHGRRCMSGRVVALVLGLV